MAEDNQILYSPYSENPPKLQIAKMNGLIITWNEDGTEVIDVRAEKDRVRLYKPKE